MTKTLTKVHHLNLGAMRGIPGDPNPRSICHCLLLEDPSGYALVDTGMGVEEMARPEVAFGRALMDAWGFEIDPANTAVHQLRRRGLGPGDIRHVVMTHLDVDHAGGLPDLPGAAVHLSAEERANLERPNPRYLLNQFAHGPHWETYGADDGAWLGLPTRRLGLGFASDVRLVPLFGHTLGHCGVLVEQEGGWLLHAGDTYYRRVEVTQDPDPVEAMVAKSCDDNALRVQSLAAVKALLRDHPEEAHFFSTHDMLEYAPEAQR